ncbi:MAG TPA: transketolase, partial [Burkholderiaceae bacterium]|jgi:transketolase|nr:transketolase [Burkholderiaceae bacterium]
VRAKLQAFGYAAVDVDGHDEAAIDAAVRRAWDSDPGRPKALVARTVKGMGVPFMAGDNRWHYTRLTAETFATACSALQSPEAAS